MRALRCLTFCSHGSIRFTVVPRTVENDRLVAVGMVRGGMSFSNVARQFRVERHTVARWFERHQLSNCTGPSPIWKTSDHQQSARSLHTGSAFEKSLPSSHGHCKNSLGTSVYLSKSDPQPSARAQHLLTLSGYPPRPAAASSRRAPRLVQAASETQSRA